ncbi:hypothetical protein BRADI_4g01065v3 [Brachypodium distachyon]|uniref:Uncharacterized protein n=1 Tax=Brachypodium distachyon TaxID=15368 RepID=A0A2K2CJS2_BRADI|nr:hypothetical protein BRADI_4g01065v3 [Brachypodium distachyon]
MRDGSQRMGAMDVRGRGGEPCRRRGRWSRDALGIHNKNVKEARGLVDKCICKKLPHQTLHVDQTRQFRCQNITPEVVVFRCEPLELCLDKTLVSKGVVL